MGAAATVAPVIALVGNPNCGKTALFNALTGSRQKVANYPGVTVEKKVGRLTTPAGRSSQIVDLPGTYSLRARSPDEEITRDVVLGRLQSDVNPTSSSASPTPPTSGWRCVWRSSSSGSAGRSCCRST